MVHVGDGQCSRVFLRESRLYIYMLRTRLVRIKSELSTGRGVGVLAGGTKPEVSFESAMFVSWNYRSK